MARKREKTVNADAPITQPGEQSSEHSDEHSSGQADEVKRAKTSELEALESELACATDQRLRALADLQNFRRQSIVNERLAREEGASGVLAGVVTVLDHFDLALTQDPETVAARSVIEGVRLIQNELLRVLSEHGARRIAPSAGEAFDPHQHEAIGHEPDQSVAPGAIVRLVQPGYALGDRLLRAAKVLVAPEQSSENNGSAADTATEE